MPKVRDVSGKYYPDVNRNDGNPHSGISLGVA